MATTPNVTQITAPRVELLDPKTGLMSREWYRFFYNQYVLTGDGSGVTAVINGGTGLSSIPSNGQLLIGNGSGYTLRTLGAGAGITVTNGSGTIVVANSGVLSWSAGTTGLTPSAVSTGAVTLAGTLIAANGGTGFASYAVGDLLYANTTTTLAKLPVGTTGQVLTIAAGVPAWATSTISAPVTKTADFTLAATESWVINNKSGSTCTVTLPTPSTYTGRQVVFKNMQAQLLVSASSNVVPLDSTSAGTAILLDVVGNWATMVSDGTNWVIMQAASNNNLLLE
jgi:hypothetical protein